MFEPASLVELAQLADVLKPPSQIGPYRLTSKLAQSQTSLIFTAQGGPFQDDEGVVKMTNSHHAARLEAELRRLVRCSDGGVRGVIWPVVHETEWLPVPGMSDAHVAAIALPFLAGGDLHAIKRARPQAMGTELARVLANTLRHLLELPEPIAYGNISMGSALLPRPGADLSELTLIDFGSAVDLVNCSRAEAAAACGVDVVAFGALLSELDRGDAIANLARECRAGKFASMADPRLWNALSPRPKRNWKWKWKWK